MADPVAFSKVLERERDQLEARRRKLEILSDAPATAGIRASKPHHDGPLRDPDLGSRTVDAHRFRPFGVCLSGGGIRSATFNLGILQGLTQRGLLPFIDYLSTVSGGGYIGTWLHGVIKRRCDGDPRKAGEVISPTEDAPPVSEPVPKRPGDATHDPVTFLRKYSNYLAPKLGLLSPDFWVIFVIWIRNMLLNQLILVPFLAGIVLMGIQIGFLQQYFGDRQAGWLDWFVGGLVAVVLLSLAVWIITKNLHAIVKREFDQVSGTASATGRKRGFGKFRSIWTFAVRIITKILPATVKQKSDQAKQPPGPVDTRGFERFWLIWTSVGFTLATSLLLGSSHADPIPDGFVKTFTRMGAQLVLPALIFVVLWALFFFVQRFGGFKKCFRHQHRKHPANWWLHLVWMPVVSAAATAALLSEVLHWISTWSWAPSSAWSTIAYGPPLVVLTLLGGAVVQIGLMGADFPDAAREWLARFAALLLISCAGWMALFSVGVFGPKWISGLALRYGKTTAGLAGTWIATTVTGVLAGKSSRTSGAGGGAQTSSGFEWISEIAPAVFMIGYLLAISFTVHEIIARYLDVYSNYQPAAASQRVVGATVDLSSPVAPAAGNTTLHIEVNSGDTTLSWLTGLRPINERYWVAYDYRRAWAWVSAVVALLACAVLVLFLPLRININEFSLHHFYKNRLVRCYLGAGRAQYRQPNPFTGFDPHDDLPIAALRAKKLEDQRATEPCEQTPKKFEPYLGPYPIVNTALNLTAGSELATQERKAASFIFSPLYSGFDPPHSREDDLETERLSLKDTLKAEGYRETRCYMYPATSVEEGAAIGGPGIGTAMGISGAAANPNDGYHTSGPMAFLMTIFDVRLGWWVGNPRRKRPSARPGPRYALGSLLSELFAQTNGRSNYLNLSDGGHFDNLGLYELVKRRCRYIIVCDGEADPDLNFESLGGAIRKCRADFGVEIDLDPKRIHAVGGPSQTHCVVGSVTYPEIAEEDFDFCGEVRPGAGPVKGWILYLKASLTGDEPEDVIQYHAGHAAFPHEPTANQFFTESQFESYRRLGLHVVESALENVGDQLKDLAPKEGKTHANLAKLFRGLCRQWYPPSTVAEGVATRHAEAYTALMKRLSEDPKLSYLDREIIPRLGKDCKDRPLEPDAPADVSEETRRKAFFYCLDLMQLMENVWADLHLYNRADRENPKNGGWMRVFRHWVLQPVFVATWGEASCTYNELFRQFFEQLQSEQSRRAPTD
jgi:hypothetical protein